VFLVWSALWNLWPDITSCQKAAVWKLRFCFCGAPLLTRGRVCSAITQWSEPRRTHNHTLLSLLPNLECQVPVFISPRNRVFQLYPLALGSLYVASYDSQGYSGGILTRLHMGFNYVQEQMSVLLSLLPFSRCRIYHVYRKQMYVLYTVPSEGNSVF
jgi:hypothetical protein